MLRLQELHLAPGQSEALLYTKAAKLLRLPPAAIQRLTVVRRGLDARQDPVRFVYTVDVEVAQEARVLRRCGNRRVAIAPEPAPYTLPAPLASPPACAPVVVGAGPAGLFATLLLARCGARPILLEQGKAVEQRAADVEAFWSGGALLPRSNVQFGEGGAGAFSDGKLNTGTKDPSHRFILETLVALGAPEDILTEARPHVGTDVLYQLLPRMREALRAAGAEIRFNHCVTDFTVQNGALTGLTVDGPEGPYHLPCQNLILAVGHSARPLFSLLEAKGVALACKPFAVGVRIEHRQADMDAALYRSLAGHPGLPPSSYKLACHTAAGRGVFSFCVCPGGQVVAAASGPEQTVTNGMSRRARDGENINGALLVDFRPEDIGAETPSQAIAFQAALERAAFVCGGGTGLAPCQRVEDFLLRRPSTGPGRVKPTYRPGVVWRDLHDCLPPFVCEALHEALPILGKTLPGYDDPDALLTGVESRSSSPLRILRDGKTLQSSLAGLYPCGEGAGYAGGILSAAADGLRCAAALLQAL